MLNTQAESISKLQTTFEERLDRLEDQFSTLTQDLDDSRETQPMRIPSMGSSHSLNE